jgi:hypothetical protein
MKTLVLTIGAILFLVGTAAAENPSRKISLFKTTKSSPASSDIRHFKMLPEITLVASVPAEKVVPSPKTPIADELLPSQLRERSYSEPDTFAGVQMSLPNFSPLNIVLAADDLLNPTCGIRFHLVW